MAANRDKTFPEKLKQFFKFSKTATQHQTGGTQPFGRLKVEKFVLTKEIQHQLAQDTPVPLRLKYLQEIGEQIATKRIEDDGAETLWLLVHDLFIIDGIEERQTALMFLKSLILGQYERLGMLRVYIFEIVRDSTFKEDTSILIELLKAVTDNGKDLLYLEETIGEFLLSFLPQVSQQNLLKAFLPCLLNVLKFNSAYLDSNVVGSIVNTLCNLAITSVDSEEVLRIIDVFDVVICYSNLPNESLVVFTSTLCRLVNVSSYSNLSWKVLRNLVGTHLGTSTLYTIIHCLQTSEDASLLRGGIFFIGMVLWSDRPPNCPSLPPVIVLPSLNEGLKNTSNPLVIFEAGLALQKLVKSDGPNLVGLAWDWVLDMMDCLFAFGNEYSKILEVYLEILNDVHQLVESGTYAGSLDVFFDAVEHALQYVEEPLIVSFIDFKLKKLTPSCANWISSLGKLVQRFYLDEKRLQPRLKILENLSTILVSQRGLFDEELMEVVILPLFQNVHAEQEVIIRDSAVKLIVSLSHSFTSKHCSSLLDILEKVMERPFNLDHGDVVNIPSEEELSDVVNCTEGLIELFAEKIHQLPSSHAIQIYKILIHHAILHYEKPIYFEFALATKLAVFNFILSLTADGDNRIGYASSNRHSPYIMIEQKHGERHIGPNRKDSRNMSDDLIANSHSQITLVSLSEACYALYRCLSQERDWKLLGMVLERIPRVLHNKALILSRHNTDIDLIGKALCALVCDPLGNPESLRNAPTKFSKAEYHQHVFRVLASLVSYHAHFKLDTQQKLVKSLEGGLKIKDTAKTCVVALTVSALEMKETMYKLLPGVLNHLSKISATVSIASSILEFLSTLNRLPEVYSSFVEKQYLSIFAITLPFINPFKFNHYIVSLAHHVVSLWFLSCKFPLRKIFVPYIVQAFKNNVLIPCEEGMVQMAQPPAAANQSSISEDNTIRGRSGSFSSHDSRRAACPTVRPSGELTKASPDEARITFHRELMETCADLMSRYTYGNNAPYAQESDTVSKLLKDGSSQTWLIGHKLVTVTTSGCTRIASQHGLCDRCHLLCRWQTEDSSSGSCAESVRSPVSSGLRRRHRSAMSPAAAHSLASEDYASQELHPSEEFLGKPRSRHKSSVDDRRVVVESDNSFAHSSDSHEKGHSLVCACYCSGWAKIHVRRPTGDTCWITRILNPPQNIGDVFLLSDCSDEQAPNLAAALSAHLEGACETGTVHPRLDRSLSVTGVLTCASDLVEQTGESSCESGTVDEAEARDRPIISRQTSLKEGSTVSRRSCEAIPEENKDADQRADDSGDIQPWGRDRVHTMPTLNVQRRFTNDANLRKSLALSDQSSKDSSSSSSSNPSFVFLQLYYSPTTNAVAASKEGADHTAAPMLIPTSMQTAIKNLDRIPPYETHKIGVLYVGKGQAGKEADILANEHGSVRYMEFVRHLGQLINLSEIDPRGTYLGGLEVGGEDGKFAYIWKDDVLQVIFHVATLMPTRPSDPLCTNKKRHIGNNYVTIVYNDSGEEHSLKTIRGQFNHACVVVEPLDHATHKVSLKCRDDLCELMGGPVEPKIVSDRNVSLLSRQMAFHTNLAALILQSKAGFPYASNWLERLRQIKRTKGRLEKEEHREREKERNPWQPHSLSSNLDFTEFTCPK